jgi:hypothetical protein
MSTKATIVSEISSHTKLYLASAWRIGLTHDPVERRRHWSNDGHHTSLWKQWQADSLTDAQDIEAAFINKGMKGGTGGDLSARSTVYVYVF